MQPNGRDVRPTNEENDVHGMKMMTVVAIFVAGGLLARGLRAEEIEAVTPGFVHSSARMNPYYVLSSSSNFRKSSVLFFS